MRTIAFHLFKHPKTPLAFLFLIMAILFSTHDLQAQIGINEDDSAPHSSAMLDVKSLDKGVLIPRVDHNNVSSPAKGLMVYDTLSNSFWFYNGTAWLDMAIDEFQDISFDGTNLSIDNGNSIDISSIDNQDISGSSLTGDVLTIGIEDGSSETVDLGSIDNQDISGSSLTGDVLTIGIEDGSSETVDLGSIDN